MRTADCEGGRKTREKEEEEEEEEEEAVADLGDTLTEKGWKLRRDVQFFFCSLPQEVSRDWPKTYGVLLFPVYR